MRPKGARVIRSPGQKLGRDERARESELTPPAYYERIQKEFDDELEKIEAAEREAFEDADQIKLT